MNRQTFNDRVEHFFREHAGEWIPASRLEDIGGRFAWRSRISDVRRERGMHIVNRQRRIKLPDGARWTATEYRYLPADLLDGLPSAPSDEASA